ncbi:MAG: hypothetical protein JSW33_17050, partial [bacterium]
MQREKFIDFALVAHLIFILHAQGNQIQIDRMSGSVKLDGMSNETAWKSITPLPVIMQEPTFNAEPSENTEILIGYDNVYLYVAARCYDSEPDKIQSPS